jgi:hypothetical protein
MRAALTIGKDGNLTHLGRSVISKLSAHRAHVHDTFQANRPANRPKGNGGQVPARVQKVPPQLPRTRLSRFENHKLDGNT